MRWDVPTESGLEHVSSAEYSVLSFQSGKTTLGPLLISGSRTISDQLSAGY